jgi:hypothetical protein
MACLELKSSFYVLEFDAVTTGLLAGKETQLKKQRQLACECRNRFVLREVLGLAMP